MKKRVADIIMDVLVENGVSECFMVVGGGAMHLDNALALCPNINKYFNHHEQASSMAAEAYARISGKLAAVCVTSGPGATNAVTGVLGAYVDGLPMIVLSGQVRYETSVERSGLPLRYRGVQEFDIVTSVKNMTKYAKQIRDPLTIRSEVQKAIDISMSGRRGPVWLDVPLDIQSAQVELGELVPVQSESTKVPVPTKGALEDLVELLRNSKRPCVLAGSGIVCGGSMSQFREFVDAMGIPVVAAAFASDVMYRDHPLYFGLSGTIGPRPGNFILQNADVILTLGSSLGFKVTGFAQDKFAPNAKIVVVDVDEYEVQKPGLNVHTFIHADLSEFFRAIAPLHSLLSIDSSWMDYCNRLRTRFSPFEPGHTLEATERVGAYLFWEKFDEFLPKDGIVALGVNTGNSAKVQIGVKASDQRIVTNINCGSMGTDLPYAIGACVAARREVICITGDGTIMMNLQELQTIRQFKLPIKVIVFSNDGYAAIRQTSKNFFNGVEIGCSQESGVSFPRFSDVAKTFGFEFNHCRTNGDLESSLAWLFSTQGHAFLEVDQRLDDPVSPKVMSRMNSDGTFATPALHDMAPFLSETEMKSFMLW